MITCDRCHHSRENVVSAMLNGRYYRHICRLCLHGSDVGISANAASFERRRQYEDNAQDTVQPYTATGPNPEFARLYPEAAAKVFNPETIARLKKTF